MDELNREEFEVEEPKNDSKEDLIKEPKNEDSPIGAEEKKSEGDYSGSEYGYQEYGYSYSNQNMPYSNMNGYVHPTYPYMDHMNYSYTHPSGMNSNYAQGNYMNANYIAPGYHNQNINGMEAMYISQNMANAEAAAKHTDIYAESKNDAFEAEQQTYPEENAENTEPEQNDAEIKTRAERKAEQKAKEKTAKKKKSHSGGAKKFAKLIASAVVFGLVAGVVFQGVRYGSDALFSKNKKTASVDTSADQNENTTEHQNTPYLEANSNSVQTVNYDVSDVAADVMPSIVSITGTYVQTYQYWFTTYEQELPGAGSGIIIGRDDEYLFILTNCHVVEGAKELEVVFVDDESVGAIVKGTNADNDVAIVLVPLEDIKEETLNQIKEITVGSSDNLKIGDPCIAIGNALGYGQSVTVGYISALEREITVSDVPISVIQTDAAINPGNSGGALVNMNGELIGVNTAKGVGSNVEGMGYALPISEISDLINDLIAAEGIQETETNEPENQASNTIEPGQTYLGISASTIDKDYAEMLGMPEGIYISNITKNSPAKAAGLQSGDIIVGFDGEEVLDMTVLQGKVADKKPGDKVEIEFYRLVDDEYEKQTVTATLQAME